MLRNGICRVIYNICNPDPTFPAISNVHVVIARCKLADQLYPGSLFQNLPAKRRLICNNNFGIPDLFPDICFCCIGIGCSFTQFFNFFYRNIKPYTVSL